MRILAWTIGGALVIAAVLFLALGMAEESASHEWYDGACCNERDCRQTVLKEVERRPNGWFVAPTGELIPFDDPKVRRSLDPLIHICLIPTTDFERESGRFAAPEKVRCIYIPEVPV